jgi:hypothetical protein
MRAWLAGVLLLLSAGPAVVEAQATQPYVFTPQPAQPYNGYQRTFSTTEVLTILGKREIVAPPPARLFSLDVAGSASTKLKCGQLGLNVNVRAMASRVAQIPQQLVDQASALIPALPMLTLCYISPSLCAELKNANFQIQDRLNGLSNVCQSIDSYIDNQVRDGAAKTGYEICMRQREDAGDPYSEAEEYCNTRSVPMTYTNIASAWLRDETTTAPQRILESLFQASGQYIAGGLGDDKYRFATAILGELKLDVNGKILPVFPAQPKTAKAVALGIRQRAIQLACNQPEFTSAAPGPGVAGLTSSATPLDWRFQEQHLFDVVKDQVLPENVVDLYILDPPDIQVACNALGRALSTVALRKVTEDAASTTSSAMANPGLKPPMQQYLTAHAQEVFRDMREQAHAQELTEHSVPELLIIIHRMAEIVKETRRNTATAISKGLNEMEREFATTPCDSEETCEP